MIQKPIVVNHVMSTHVNMNPNFNNLSAGIVLMVINQVKLNLVNGNHLNVLKWMTMNIKDQAIVHNGMLVNRNAINAL